jgi:hypothetical protein
MTVTNAALLIANDNKRGKTKPAAALHNFRDAIDVNELIDKLVVALFAIVVAVSASTTLASTAFAACVFVCHD